MTLSLAPRSAATELRLHIEELLAEHLVSVDYRPGAQPHADLARRHVVLPPVDDPDAYAAAMELIAAVVGSEAP